MSELRVPTRALTTHVVCADDREFRGRLFVPETSMRHDGAMRAIEMLNDPSAFFPFQPDDGAGEYFLLNKAQIIVVTVEAGADLTSPADEEMPHVTERRVVVECGSHRVEGIVSIQLPGTHSRVLDWMNHPDRFLVLEDGARHHLVQKQKITRIIEVREE
jgi:hypothetical protein